MSLRKLPDVKCKRPQAYQADTRADALERWRPMAADSDDAATICVYDVIGEDWWTGDGVTSKTISAALRSVGARDVTVNINSPGGDMFEGLAIYNILREHPAKVNVRVMGLAASAASIIAMAGDTVEMGLGSFLMIHNSWGMVVGNQDDMRTAASTFAEFDAAMAGIYASRSGKPQDEIASMMAEETWLRAETAIDAGFANATFAAPDYEEVEDTGMKARAALDATLARAGLPRSERRRLLREAAGTPSAAGTATPRAGFDVDAVARLISTLKA